MEYMYQQGLLPSFLHDGQLRVEGYVLLCEAGPGYPHTLAHSMLLVCYVPCYK